MSLADAFAPYEAKQRESVMEATWGHLAPKKRKTYRGYIVFTHSIYGDILNIANDFGELPDSPWFFQAMMDFICSQDTEQGCVYRFDGTFRNYQFTGTARKVSV